MKTVRGYARVVSLTLFFLTALVAGWDAMAADVRAEYRDTLKRQGAAGMVARVVAAYSSANAAGEIAALESALAESRSPQLVGEVFAQLDARKTAEAAGVGVELLAMIAARDGGRALASDPLWKAALEQGVAWLAHDDPLVRSLAAWSLAAARDAAAPSAACRAVRPEESIECDFALELFLHGAHRSEAALAQSADALAGRALALADGALFHGKLPPQDRLARAVRSLAKAIERQPALGKSDLAAARRSWFEVRRAVREVVLAAPDLDFRDTVHFQTPPRTEGNHPDCLVQNHDRPKERAPGGDIFVQSGPGPGDPSRPLLAGRLGPGHVQDMDLWWDADRLVFAYVRQPRWGDGRSAWGAVEWRNGPDTSVVRHKVGYEAGVFWENGSEPTHLFEVRLDGSGLRQLTDDPLYCDREPAYLPDGDVVFSSDRSCGASQCGAAPLAYSDFGLPNLFRVSADGRCVKRLTYNKDVDRYPHCLDNGLIGYMRWDYQERFWQWPHALWTIRPDGTMNDGLYKTHFNDPQSVREPRSIPGVDRLVVIACGHHAPPEGAVAIVTPSAGANNPQALRYVTPQVTPLEGGLGTSPTVVEGGVRDRGGLYRTPWPLSEKAFLVSYTYDATSPSPAAARNYAAYYIDVWGNKELIRRVPGRDVLCPMAVRPRVKPPVLPGNVAPATSLATSHATSHALCVLDDVYRDLPGVPRGAVRYLRISEPLQWYFEKKDNTGPIRWTPGTQHMRNFGYWTWSPVRVVGTVPVEADGSAYFKAPAGLALYFQALDENFMELRRMRAHVEFQPGEVRGCVGCHETKAHVSRSGPRGRPLALAREPSTPKPPPWGDREIVDYEAHIQPIWDRRCVSCHGAAEPKKGLDLSGTRDAYGFAQSYRSLFGVPKGVATPLGEGFREAFADIPKLKPDEDQLYEAIKRRIYQPGDLLCLSNHMGSPEVTRPMQFGSHRSRLVRSLLDLPEHRKDAAMSRGEWEAVVTWVDANAPYHARFYQYFDADGKLLARPIQVRLELDPPFAPGEKTVRRVAETPQTPPRPIAER